MHLHVEYFGPSTVPWQRKHIGTKLNRHIKLFQYFQRILTFHSNTADLFGCAEAPTAGADSGVDDATNVGVNRPEEPAVDATSPSSVSLNAAAVELADDDKLGIMFEIDIDPKSRWAELFGFSDSAAFSIASRLAILALCSSVSQSKLLSLSKLPSESDEEISQDPVSGIEVAASCGGTTIFDSSTTVAAAVARTSCAFAISLSIDDEVFIISSGWGTALEFSEDGPDERLDEETAKANSDSYLHLIADILAVDN